MKVCLHWLARRLMRGPHADFIRHDLEEMYARDRANGVSAVRAQASYLHGLIGSAFTVWRGGLHRPHLPRLGWLELKLAGRMLVRYPGVSLVACLALTIGIPASLAPIQLLHALNAPPPFREADRIIGLEFRDLTIGNERRATIHDFERWQRELTSVTPLAAARRRFENVVGRNGLTDVVRGAEMTATGFDIAEVPPLLGRRLVEADQAKGADPVVVIGHDLWMRHFGGDAAALGHTLQVGRVMRAVVGVMPEGFLFPAREHFWVPLQLQATDVPVGEGPRLLVFGRLRDDVSSEQAQTELRAIGQRLTTENPDTYAKLRSDVLPYMHAVTGLKASYSRTYPAILMCVLLLAVTAGNVGTLMLARAATRSNEIAVRHALGAGRARIVLQFFVESLLLALSAAAAGLLLADLALTRFFPPAFAAAMPFWFNLHVTAFTVEVAVALAAFSAVIAGLLPALKATRPKAFDSLKRQSAGASGLRFGRTATVLIVVEVAIAVAGLSGVGSIARGAFKRPSLGADIRAEEFLKTELVLPPDRLSDGARLTPAEWRARLAAVEDEISRRLTREPGVRAVTIASALPGMDHGGTVIEVEGDVASPRLAAGYRVRTAYVEPGFFQALGERPVMGREFQPTDLRPSGRDVVVNRSFVDQVLHGRPPIGVRIRQVRPPDQPAAPWREIIGVVNDLGMNVVNPAEAAGVYQVVTHGEVQPAQLVVRLAGDPTSFVPRLRTVLNEIEPGIVLENPARLDEVFSERLWQARLSSVIFALIAVIGVVLSAAGLYALMALSVTQRTREIAIRTALGARQTAIVRTIVGRAFLQLTIGVAMGAALGALIVPEVLNEHTQVGHWRAMLVAVSAGMVAIGLLACAVPTRRALGIQPVAALKEQG